MTRLPAWSVLDAGALPVAALAVIAKREGVRPREAYGAHRWFARRTACTARALAVAAVTPADADFPAAYHGGADLVGVNVLDPFMGGGVMVEEAVRLGADVTGTDVEPVPAALASFQGRLRDLPDLAPHLDALAATVGADLAPFYATRDAEGAPGRMVHAFHVQVVTCGACGRAFDAHPRFRLAWDGRASTQWVACQECSDVAVAPLEDARVACRCGASTDPTAGHGAGGRATCPGCGHVEPLIALARRTGAPPAFRPFAVETIPDVPEVRVPMAGRTIRETTRHDLDAHAAAVARLADETRRDSGFLPASPIPREGRHDGRLVDYGHRDYAGCLLPRQALHLGLLARAVLEVGDPRVREALAVAFSDHTATNNAFCAYAGGWRRLAPLFSIRAYRHVSRPVELNPWLRHNGRGTFPNAVRAVTRAARGTRALTKPRLGGGAFGLPEVPRGRRDLRQGDARDLSHVPDGSVDLVLTDPPYFDYVAYSELGHWYVPWLVRLGLVDASHLDRFPAGQVAVPHRGTRAARVDAFAAALTERLTVVARKLSPDGRMVLTFQNRDGRGWLALGRALAASGLHPLVTFPAFGDGGAGPHRHPGSVSWDCVVVCGRGEPVAPLVDLAPWEGDGRALAASWSGRLAAQGHALSEGDVANLSHAGAIVAALATPSDMPIRHLLPVQPECPASRSGHGMGEMGDGMLMDATAASGGSARVVAATPTGYEDYEADDYMAIIDAAFGPELPPLPAATAD